MLEVLKGRAIPISLWILIGSIIGGLLLLALIIFILWKVFLCNISLQISSGNQCLTDSILSFFLASHQLGFFARKQRGEEENHEDWAQLLLPSQQSFAMMTNVSPPHARHRDSPGIGLDTQTQQGPPGPKSIWGSNWNALPTISRVGSTYVNFKEKPKCVKPQFFYLIYRLIHGFTIQSLFPMFVLQFFVFVL